MLCPVFFIYFEKEIPLQPLTSAPPSAYCHYIIYVLIYIKINPEFDGCQYTALISSWNTGKARCQTTLAFKTM